MKNQPVVVVRKRRGGVRHEAHGGAWKIAYADFMTAMMAFFLVMWLLSIASPQELTTIAEYFRTPLATALTGGARSSDDSSPIPGGGDDPTRQEGDVHKSIDQLVEKLEKKRLNQLHNRLDQLIESDPRLRVLRPQLLINMVSEGLQIQILDSQNRPMFETGSARVEPYMRDVLRGIAPILNDIPNKLSISGHTDSIPYATGERGYSNWELSADRANASRRELTSGGLADGKVLRVVGMSSMMSLDPKQPDAAINRRISLLVLNRKTEEMIEHEGAVNPTVDVNKSGDLSQKPAFNSAASEHGKAPAGGRPSPQTASPAGNDVSPGAAGVGTPAGTAAPGAAPVTTQPGMPAGTMAPAQPGAPAEATAPGATQSAAPAGTTIPEATQPAAPAGASAPGATQSTAPAGTTAPAIPQPGTQAGATAPGVTQSAAPAGTTIPEATQPAAPAGTSAPGAAQSAAPVGGAVPTAPTGAPAASQPAAPAGTTVPTTSQPAEPAGTTTPATVQPAAPADKAAPATTTPPSTQKGHPKVSTAIRPAPDARSIIPVRNAGPGGTAALPPSPAASTVAARIQPHRHMYMIQQG